MIKQEQVESKSAELVKLQQRLRALSEEASNLPGQLKEASTRAAGERAQAARAGEDFTHVASDLDVEGLQDRQNKIGLELWAMRLAVAEAKVALHDAEEEAAKAQLPVLKSVLQTANRELEEAQKRRNEADYAYRVGEREVDTARHYRRVAEREVASLENEHLNV